MKNKELKALIDEAIKIDKTNIEVLDVYVDNGDATVLISIPFGRSEYSFSVSENDLTSWKDNVSTLNDIDWYADIMDIHDVSKEEKMQLLKEIEAAYDMLLKLQYKMN